VATICYEFIATICIFATTKKIECQPCMPAIAKVSKLQGVKIVMVDLLI